MKTLNCTNCQTETKRVAPIVNKNGNLKAVFVICPECNKGDVLTLKGGK